MKLFPFLLSLAFLLFCSIISQAQVKGQIVDEDGNGVPYAIIGSSEYKTIADGEGYFELAIQSLEEFTISSVGYKEKTIKKSIVGEQNEIVLKQSSVNLKGVVVTKKIESPKKLIKRVIKAIDTNYHVDTVSYSREMFKIFKLDTVDLIYTSSQQQTDFDGYSERAVYMNNQKETTTSNQKTSFSVIKNAKETISDTIPSKFRFIRRAYASRLDFLNWRRHTFLNLSKLGAFEYSYNWDKTSDGILAIDVLNENPNHRNACLALSPTLFKATIYINETDLAITKIETYVELDKEKMSFIPKWYPIAYKNVPIWTEERVLEYVKNKETGLYFLSHAYATDNYSFKEGGYTEWVVKMQP